MKLSNEVALITGAASGIGKAQALLFAKEGAKIIVADIQAEKAAQTAAEIQAQGGTAVAVTTDISDESQVSDLIEQGLTAFGKISILCNTAGLFDNLQPILQTDLAAFKKIMSTNIEGTFLVTKHTLPIMIRHGRGSIVNMTSDAGLIGGGGGAAYSTSKHAIIGLTRQLNAELGHQGIRANAIAPGLIQTPMVQPFMQDKNSPIMETFKKIPAQRPGQPDDIAKASLFLASQDSEYIYGQVLSVDGGLISTLRLQ